MHIINPLYLKHLENYRIYKYGGPFFQFLPFLTCMYVRKHWRNMIILKPFVYEQSNQNTLVDAYWCI